MTLKKNTKDTSNWSLRSSVTAGTNRWTFRRGPMHFCSLINPDRLRDRTSHPMCRLVCSAVWENDMERPLMPTYAIRDDSDDWSDCSTLNGNVVYISWHIDYIDMISISILARISIDRPIASFKTSEVNIWGDYWRDLDRADLQRRWVPYIPCACPPGGGGAFGYFLGGYVPSGTPNWHPVLKNNFP